MKKNVKGFTLTEMIVVIAIIGILAAVLIPSVVIYVQRAQRSNDEQVAASMTDEIERYCIEHEIDQADLLGTDIRTLLAFRGYETTPSRNKWTFVYDVENRTVNVVDIENVKVNNNNFTDPTNYQEGFYLIGNGESELEEVVKILCRVTSLDAWKSADELAKDGSTTQKLVDYFNPTHTLYISNSKVFASLDQLQGANKTVTYSSVVFTEKTVHIPSFLGSNLSILAPGQDYRISGEARMSAILKTIDEGAELAGYFPELKAVNSKNIVTLNDQFMNKFHDYLDQTSGLSIKGNVGFQLGENFEAATAASIDLVPVQQIKVDIDKNTEKIFITYRLTICYYNENGLFARGVTQCAYQYTQTKATA